MRNAPSPRRTLHPSSGWIWLGVAAVLGLQAWLGGGRDDWLRGYAPSATANDYYNLLVDGFRDGHTYLKVTPDPGLLSADPAVRAQAPTLLDASFFQGRFYLYFGVAPVVLLLLPFSLLTGMDLPLNAATLAFVFVGFGFSLALLRSAARAHRIPLQGPFAALAVLLLGFATATPFLVSQSMFYELAIAAGHAAAMAGAYWLHRAWLHGSAALLALASLSFGLAVAGRPDHLLALPLVALVAWRHYRAGRGRQILFAAIWPAGLVGAGLAAYNFARFGDPLDSGFAYSQNDFFHTGGHTLISPAFFTANLFWYYLSPPSFSPYFPYVFPVNTSVVPAGYFGVEVVHGQWTVSLLAAFVAGSACLLRRRLAGAWPWMVLAGLGWMFLLPFGFLGQLGIRSNRYMADFHPPLVLGLVLAAAVTAAALPVGRLRRLWLTTFGLLGSAAVAANVLAAIQQSDRFAHTRPATYLALSRAGVAPAAWWGRLTGAQPGHVRFQVQFPPPTDRITVEPLLTVGRYGYSVSLYARQFPDNHVEFLFDHAGAGGAKSIPIPIVPGREYELEVELGALYPPAVHPLFDGVAPDRVQWLKTRERVVLDGTTVLEAAHAGPDAPPGTLVLGRNDVALTTYATRFRGRVSGLAKTTGPLPSSAASNNGAWRWSVELPAGTTGSAQPLLETGARSGANLLTVMPVADDQVRFSLDGWGYGAQVSPPIRWTMPSEHLVEVFVGPLAANAERPTDWLLAEKDFLGSRESVRVWLDGQLVWSALARGTAASFRSGRTGANTLGFSGSTLAFRGRITGGALTGTELRSFLERNRDAPSDGVWRLYCQPAADLAPGSSLPLLATGVSGAGNLLYLQVLGDRQIRFGLDQWGAGSTFSAPLPWPQGTSRTLEVFVGPATGADGDSRIRIWVDGNLAASFPSHNPRDTFNPISVGTNHQGFSTARGIFDGRLESQPHEPAERREFLARNRDGTPPPAPGGLWRMLLAVSQSGAGNQPLLAFGRTGAGNLVFLAPQADGTWRLGLDEWGMGGGMSEQFALDPGTEHELEIFAGPAAAAQDWPGEWNLERAALNRSRTVLRVWLDGRPIWTTLARNAASTYVDAKVGANPQGFSTAGQSFAGQWAVTPYTPAGQLDFLQRNLARPSPPESMSAP